LSSNAISPAESRLRQSATAERVEVGLPAEVGRALEQIAATLSLSKIEAAIGCYVALAFRHVQRPMLSVRVSTERGTQPVAVNCVIDETATMQDLVLHAVARYRQPIEALPDTAAFAVLLTIDDATSLEQETRVTLELQTPTALSFPWLEELARQFQGLAAQMAESASRSILDYSLVTEAARALLPDPSARIEMPHYKLLTELVVAQAVRYPEAIAVVETQRAHSYAQLVAAARTIAACVTSRGIASGDVVAITGPRGFAMASAMLGVFMAGAVLLTLDPKLPLERRKSMLGQAQAKCLLNVDRCGEVNVSDVPVIELDATARPRGSDQPPVGVDALPVLDPQAPAFVFFTSGSTGTPKAVLGSHAGAAHLLDWQRHAFDINVRDRAAQIISVSFDAVLRDVFLVLTCGGTLCIPQEDDILDPQAFLSWLAKERISFIHVVPSLLRTWLNHCPGSVDLPALRFVFLSGEPVTDLLVERFRTTLGTRATLVNLYGPTETTMVKCFHVIEATQPGIQPIGVPMPQTQVLIFNGAKRLCGIGESGHIAIRTPFCTLGYLRDPAATRRAFTRNPYRNDAKDFLYWTGDKGRYRTDGLLEIGGRIDDQVKIRGVRVEPAEIEYAICQCSGIHDAAVKAFEDPSGGHYLVAYVVPTATMPRETCAANVGDFLRRTLPDHLIPAAFVVLDRMPLNANGKVDKKSLPPPGREASVPDAAPGTTRLERELMKVWGSALGVSQVGLDESFGALGGDSLTSVGVVIAMKAIGVPDEVAKSIFTGASIRQIAVRVGKEKSAGKVEWSSPETSILVRAVSIVLVVAAHFGLVGVEGTIKALLTVSGVSFARFQLQAIRRQDGVKPVFGFLSRLAVPTLLWTICFAFATRPKPLATYLFVDNFVGPQLQTAWFIELLLQCLVITAAPLALRPVRRFALSHSYAYGLMFMISWWLASLVVPLFWDTEHLYNRVPHRLLWLMAYGWCAVFSNDLKKKLLSSAVLILCSSVSWMGWYPLAAGLLITWFDRLPLKLPPAVVSAINVVAAASLFIYLTHFNFARLLYRLGVDNPYLAVLAAVLGGIVVSKGWELALTAFRALKRELGRTVKSSTAGEELPP
jgi:amino acid adenylation domain-containing protein